MAIQAKLVSGESYTLSRENVNMPSKRFLKDVWTTITEAEREQLEENARQRVTIKKGSSIEASFVPMFEFRDGVDSNEKGETDEIDAPVRKRARG